MFKKILISLGIIVGLLVIVIGGFFGWFRYQLREMKLVNTGEIFTNMYTIKGEMGNMYLLKKGQTIIAFDAGDNTKKISEGCKALNIDPKAVKAVFLTHSDGDHVNGLPVFTSAKVYIAQDEERLLKDKNYRHFLGRTHLNKLPVSSYTTLKDGDSVEVGGITVHAIATPGHTLGSMCYRVEESLFTGDLMMIVDGKAKKMLKIFTEDLKTDSISIRKIASFDNFSSIYTAHTGYSNKISEVFSDW